MFLQKAKDLKREVFNNITEFVQSEYYSENFKVKEILPMEMCKIFPELTGSSDFQECHYDMGIYGLDSPKPLVETVVEHLKNQSSDIEAIILDGDFIAHGHAGNMNMTFEEKSETWADLKNILASDM